MRQKIGRFWNVADAWIAPLIGELYRKLNCVADPLIRHGKSTVHFRPRRLALRRFMYSQPPFGGGVFITLRAISSGEASIRPGIRIGGRPIRRGGL